MKKIINKIKEFISRISTRNQYVRCYNNMEDQGIAVFGMCGGQMGGDANTEYLSYSCVSCPYLVLPPANVKEKKNG